MKALLLTSLLAGTFLLSGCVISIDEDSDDGYRVSSGASWEKSEKRNRQYIATASTGVSKTSVVDKLGAADFNEMVSNDGDLVQVLYYRTQRVDDDGITTKNECTPLVFVNDKLVGWGELSLAKYL
mmetsp:Transcript_56059/g.177641  ORF Transcript_56059/g.177641 Transcript_56059/m.177641 type:complete len:126 (+) Transcript_56059:142-519(+)|eukprot:CAMPEP_0182883552 /NCGR_PEP_ID=MMETSP0034_2-20130328/18448_1 /TAXON_ID=156128 /ORGANISM="Nephroselmis pyriformis, Strain CCMP717" /LENGTH=125 /DNA_ID=CAMNT_0025016695 /DNA_START=105 /DNA_END=482 /DNA_ORIENTATION=+